MLHLEVKKKLMKECWPDGLGTFQWTTNATHSDTIQENRTMGHLTSSIKIPGAEAARLHFKTRRHCCSEDVTAGLVRWFSPFSFNLFTVRMILGKCEDLSSIDFKLNEIF